MSNIRIQLAAGLLAGILLVIAAARVTVDRRCAEYLALTEQIADKLAHDEDAAAEIAALTDAWEAHSRGLHLVLPNQFLSDLDLAAARLPALYASDCDELRAEVAGIAAELEWIRIQERTVF